MYIAFQQMLAVAQKDIRSELRTRYALNSLGMFVVVVVAVMAFSAGDERISPAVTAGLLWVSMFFAAISGLGRSFISEEERGTTLLLRLTVPATPVYFGKLLVNLVLAVLTNGMIALLFFAMMNGVAVKSPGAFTVVILCSSVGFASALTIIAAIIARSSSKGALYPVLAFPVILPLLLLGVTLMERTLTGGTLDQIGEDLLLLLLYTTALVIVSYILFDFLWKE